MAAVRDRRLDTAVAYQATGRLALEIAGSIAGRRSPQVPLIGADAVLFQRIVPLRRLAAIVAAAVFVGCAGGVAQAAPGSSDRGEATFAWKLDLVTDLIQEGVAAYAQSPSVAAVNLQDAGQPGYVWTMPVLKRDPSKDKTAGGLLFINFTTQAVVNLSQLTVHHDSRTVSAIASFSTSGYQGRMTVFSYAKGKGSDGDVRGARLTLARGMADRLNSALKSSIFSEGMTLGTFDLRRNH